MSKIYSVVLAAGQGTRMKSEFPKVLHKVCGKPMIDYVIEVLYDINIQDIVVVTGHKSDEILNHLENKVQFAKQEKQLGTGDAVLQAKALLSDKKGMTLVICGDTPLIRMETIQSLIDEHQAKKAAATILTAEISNPIGYGRIIRDEKGFVVKIVEEKEATLSEKKVKEINSGVYCFDNEKLFNSINKIDNNNSKGEYYLTDIIGVFKDNGEIVTAYCTEDANEIVGINDRVIQAEAEKILKKRINDKHMKNGVTIIDPYNTYIEMDVIIERDTTIYPNTYLKGKTHIKSNCRIGPGADITDTEIDENVIVTYSVIMSSKIDKDAKIGPFSYLRPGSNIGESVKIGDFVEIKNSTLGKKTKVPHLSYIGDSDLGEEINIGCGTITVNYNGYKKNRVKIDNNSFVGCNTNLIAPLTIGKRTYIAAGSTITDDVPDDTLSIAREKQINKIGYSKKIREKGKGNSND